MDGNGSLFGTVSGNTREVLGKFSVELPKKHGRGGQSALRFARLRMEKRHNYVRKVRDTLLQSGAGPQYDAVGSYALDSIWQRTVGAAWRTAPRLTSSFGVLAQSGRTVGIGAPPQPPSCVGFPPSRLTASLTLERATCRWRSRRRSTLLPTTGQTWRAWCWQARLTSRPSWPAPTCSTSGSRPSCCSLSMSPTVRLLVLHGLCFAGPAPFLKASGAHLVHAPNARRNHHQHGARA